MSRKFEADHYLVISIVCFIFGMTIGSLDQGGSMSDYFVAVVTALATLVAAYGGASYAFSLQSKRESDNRKNREINTGNIAIFYLIEMYKELADYQQQVIEPVRDNPFRYYHLQPTLPPVIEGHINYDDLAFVLSGENPDVLARVSHSINWYKRAIQKIEERSCHHLRTVQLALDNAGLTEQSELEHIDFQSILGDRNYSILVRSTDDVIELVDESLGLLKDCHDHMSELLNKRHPSSNIIRMNL